MSAVFSLMVVLALSFFATRAGAIALTLTGLSRDLARFQAISAFTGVGFTTTEAEQVLNQPVRRRIVISLMILGNAGVVAAVSSLILSFTDLAQGQWWQRALFIAGGVLVIWIIRSSRRFGNGLDAIIRRLLTRTTRLDVADYSRMLDLDGDYEVRTLCVRKDDWLQGQPLDHAELFQEGILVLGLHRPDGHYLGIPRGETKVRTGDQLVLYGAGQELRELESRRKGAGGDAEHHRAKAHHRKARDRQRSEEERTDSRDPVDEDATQDQEPKGADDMSSKDAGESSERPRPSGAQKPRQERFPSEHASLR